MQTIAAIAAIAATALAGAFAFAPRDALNTAITIDAPPAVVWQVLTDFSAYPGWNPFIRSIAGEAAAGARLTLRIGPVNGAPMTIRPRLTEVQHARSLRWRGRILLPRIMDAEHSFTLAPDGEGTRLTHAETFRGVLMWVMKAETFRPDFEAMNAALKARAEAIHRQVPSG